MTAREEPIAGELAKFGPHDFDNLSVRQVAALGNVAFGGHGFGVAARTLQSLAERGLIVEVPCARRDCLGEFSWSEYEMSIPIHIAFCEWCESQSSESETR